ncbi:MAG TPA: hypothetical protein VL576_00735 [Candidatus Paceibacterota bacterium]|jgi:hypothetical protein|nr:hypothetical protein [Candidatus Paceibacterota bacterium]
MIGKLRILFWLGVLMLFLPFLGIPNTWKTIIAVIIGIALIALSILLRRKYRSLRHMIRTLEHSVIEQPIHHE